MTPQPQQLVKQISCMIIVAVFMALSSSITLALGSPTVVTATSPGSQYSGNYDKHTLIATSVITYYMYLPIVQHDNNQLTNGDFETGDFTEWQTSQGSFSGRGSGLPQAVVSFDDSWRAHLGNP